MQAVTGWSRWMTWWSWVVNQIPCVSSPTSSPFTTTCASLSEAHTSSGPLSPIWFETQPFSTLLFIVSWGAERSSWLTVPAVSREEMQSWHERTLNRLDCPLAADQWTFLCLLQGRLSQSLVEDWHLWLQIHSARARACARACNPGPWKRLIYTQMLKVVCQQWCFSVCLSRDDVQ